MKYRILGSTGLNVSVVGMGTWQFGGAWGKDFQQEEVNAMFAMCRQVGINLIDTAECYGDHVSERLIGAAIEGQRDQWIIATKFGHKAYTDDPKDGWRPEGVRRQLEDSLRSLRTDYIDLYQFHSGNDELFDTEGLWSTLDRFKQQGKVRHLGISIGSNDNIYQTDKASAVGAEAIQVVYNRINQTPEQRVFDSCIRQHLGVLARVPLASGFLSGKYTPQAQFPEGDVRARRERQQIIQTVEQVERIKREELPAGVNMATWALAWCLQHPAVTCVIPGCKSVQQVAQNAAAADLDLVREDHPQTV
jgi:myo-inositol catabolism protein IolS